MILYPELRLAYVPVPKNGCTTIKHYLFEMQNNRRFEPFQVGPKKIYIHSLLPARLHKTWNSDNKLINEAKTSDAHIFAVVRDPISRVLSCYSNRVIFHNDIGKSKNLSQKLKSKGLPSDPDLNTFIKNLETYRAYSKKINHHIRPQIDFLGSNPNFYSKIYAIDKIDTELLPNICEFSGINKNLSPRRLQTGGKSLTKEEITNENIAKIHHLYSEDYQVFGQYFRNV